MNDEKPTYEELKKEIEGLKKRISKSEEAHDALPVGVFIYDDQGIVYQHNKYFTKLFGYDINDIPSIEDWFMLACPDENYRKEVTKRWFKEIEKYKTTGEFTPVEACIKCKDGTYKNIEFGFEVLGDTYLTSLVDFTKQKEVEQALKENEEKYRKLYENANDAIFIMNGEVFIDCNEEALTMFECDREHIIGCTPHDFSPIYQPDGSPSKEKAKKLIESSLNKEIKVFEWMHVTHKNRLFYAEVGLNLLTIDGKKYIQAIVRDINDRKVAEIELKKYKNQLEELVKERTNELESANEELKSINGELSSVNSQISQQKEEFGRALKELKSAQSQLVQSEKMASLGLLTAGVSHEINNPLNYIQAGIYSLENIVAPETSNYEQIKVILAHMQEGINRVSKIVKGLNSFSKISQDKTDVCDIHKVLDNSLLMLDNELIPNCNIEKQYFDKNISIKANEGELHHVFTNILQNSIHAINESGIIKIQTGISGNGHLAQIAIEDNGKGILKENMPKICDPFFTTKEPGKGTGLGLSIAFRIIKEHKGTIKFNSEINKGTKVLVTLPIKQ